jgi:hypothetical protein
VAKEKLIGRDDLIIWEAAQAADRFLITQDLDFSDIGRYEPGSHNGLLLLRLRMPGRIALAQRVHSIFQSEDVDSWKGCFVIATDLKIRVRKPE